MSFPRQIHRGVEAAELYPTTANSRAVPNMPGCSGQMKSIKPNQV